MYNYYIITSHASFLSFFIRLLCYYAIVTTVIIRQSVIVATLTPLPMIFFNAYRHFTHTLIPYQSLLPFVCHAAHQSFTHAHTGHHTPLHHYSFFSWYHHYRRAGFSIPICRYAWCHCCHHTTTGVFFFAIKTVTCHQNTFRILPGPGASLSLATGLNYIATAFSPPSLLHCHCVII